MFLMIQVVIKNANSYESSKSNDEEIKDKKVVGDVLRIRFLLKIKQRKNMLIEFIFIVKLLLEVRVLPDILRHAVMHAYMERKITKNCWPKLPSIKNHKKFLLLVLIKKQNYLIKIHQKKLLILHSRFIFLLLV